MTNDDAKQDLAQPGDRSLSSATSQRRPYVPPAIQRLGSVRELTLAKTVAIQDFAPSNTHDASSSRDLKQDIRYLDALDRKEIVQAVLDLKLASYDYRIEANEEKGRRLGFIVEDAPDAPFVLKDARKVDVYAFASGIAAVVQDQQAMIKKLEAEVLTLKAAMPR